MTQCITFNTEAQGSHALFLRLMAIIGHFQCDPWCLPTQNWLKVATNDISNQEFHNFTRQYVKDTVELIPDELYF